MKKALFSLKGMMRMLPVLASSLFVSQSVLAQESVARLWNETHLNSIRHDLPRPTVQARNLYHATIAMYDAWAVYDDKAETILLGKTLGNYTTPFNGIVMPADVQAAQEKALSYAMYRLMAHRYQLAPGVITIYNNINATMTQLGFNPAITSIDYSDGDPAKLGNYIAHHLIQYGLQDGSNESANHASQYYVGGNSLAEHYINLQNFAPGNPLCNDPNRWQTLSLSQGCAQGIDPCLPVPNTPPHLTPEWGNVVPFALQASDITFHERDGGTYKVYHDQGMPPTLDLDNPSDIDSFYKWAFMMVPVWQAQLDPDNGLMIDVSPGSMGNNQWYPENHNLDEYMAFYNFEGGDNSPGHSINPVTGQPYPPQMVKYGDWARVLAEFWADGPASETPPGHWFSVVNHAVFDHPMFEWKWNGQGDPMPELEFHVKTYIALGGALHDAAITCWGHKGYYDYCRPITAVRYMADRGQSTDPLLPNYHPQGYPLLAGHSELVMPGDPLAGPNDEHLYKVKLHTWMGPPHLQFGLNDNGTTNFQDPIGYPGVDWILAEQWYPYQRPTFVTPPFAGYMSGHSTYSRTAAELLTLVTGSNYFPGGVSNFVAPQNQFLAFEDGPSQDVIFQWATYQDASDQCSLSRIFGGIHPVIDDIPGRHLGMILGPQAYEKADALANGGVPKVINLSFTQNVVNDNLVGNQFGIIATFNRPMDQSVAPGLTFPGTDASATLTPNGIAWIDAATAQFLFNVSDANVLQNVSSVKITGGMDLEAKSQQVYLGTGFLIDTHNPSVSASSVNTSMIADSNSGSSALMIDITFDQPMNQSVAPAITFPATNPGSALIVNAGASVWQSATQYHLVLNAPDTNIELNGIEMVISGGQDINENAQGAEIVGSLTIDTKNPTVVLATANDYSVSAENVGSGTFEIVIIFSEAMDMNVAPVITFPGQNPVSAGALTFNSGASEWMGNAVYVARYNVTDGQVQMAGIDVQIAAALDAPGNIMMTNTLNAFFSVNLGVSISETSGGTGALVVYPNPVVAGQAIVVDYPIGFNASGFVLYDMNGKLVRSAAVENKADNRLVIPTQGLSAGIYYLNVASPGAELGTRIILSE